MTTEIDSLVAENTIMVSDYNKSCINVDTFTEKCFFELCSQNDEKIKIFYEWQTNKERYIRTSSATMFDFQNYSLHDSTHSREIIIAVEKFLGKHRIKLLGIGDLWLFLNAAYGHDTGMNIKYDEAVKLWRDDDEFHEYIMKLANSPEYKLQEEARFYVQLHNILRKQEQMDGLNSDKFKIDDLTRDWPVQLKKKTMVLTNEYIRERHAQRSKMFLDRFADTVGLQIAERRLYKVLGEVAFSHNEDYSYILEKLKREVDGFESEKMHPQFIASLLRLGDLLDMDNNRFDPYIIEHFGAFPTMSQAHLNKHLSLTHLLITEERIEATEETEDEETSRVCARWFRMIENEVKDLTSNWNNIAPKEIGGCTFYKCDLKIYLKGFLYKQEEHEKFKVDEKKFMDVLIGDKLYEDPFVFMREYLQNAMDAAKVMLGIKSQNEWSNNIYKKNISVLQEQTPLDLNPTYLEELAITIEFSIIGDASKGEKEKVKVVFRDSGIGIDEECIKVLSVIGTSWRGRTKYRKNINQMKPWTYPTGGFGVGIQSGFMVTDEITIRTLGMHDQQGSIIVIKSPRAGGEISVLGDNKKMKTGTEIELLIEKEQFILSMEQLLENERKKNYPPSRDVSRPGSQLRFLDKDLFIKTIVDNTVGYIEEVVPNCLFPIRIRYTGATLSTSDIVIKGKMLSVLSMIEEHHREYQYDEDFAYIYTWKGSPKERILCIWDCEEKIYSEIHADPKKRKDKFCYRGIQVKAEKKKPMGNIISEQVNLFVDFMSSKSEDWLTISRNAFKQDKSDYIRQQGNRIFRFYVKALAQLNDDLTNREIAAVFLGMIKYWDMWSAQEKTVFNEIKKNFEAVDLVYDLEQEKYFLKPRTDVSFSSIYNKICERIPILWKPTVLGEGNELEQTLILENIKVACEEQGFHTLVERYVGENLFGTEENREPCHSVLILTDENITFYLDEDKHPKCYAAVKTKDGDIFQKFGYMVLQDRQKRNADIKEQMREAIEKEYSFVQLDDVKGYEALLLSKLPEGDFTRSFCLDRSIILFPLGGTACAVECNRCQDDNYHWETFWSHVQENDIWLKVVDWTVQHPKNDKTNYGREKVISQYRKLCTNIFEVMKSIKRM